MKTTSNVIKFSVALLTLFSNTALASPLDVIIQDLKPRIGTTDVPFHTYSYAKASRVGVSEGEVVNISDSKIQSFLTNKANEYFDTNAGDPNGTMPGFYLAIDPVISRSYGGDGPNWVLYRLEIPKGLRFLDVSYSKDVGWERNKMPANVVKALGELGCNPRADNAKYFNYQDLFQNGNQGKVCRKVVNQILEQLGIDMIKYRWSAAPIPGCKSAEADDYDGRAIVLLHPDKVPTESMRVFTANTPDSPNVSDEKRYLDEVMRLENYPVDNRLWDKSPFPMDKPSFESWAKKHLLNCMPRENSEIASPCNSSTRNQTLDPKSLTNLQTISSVVQ